MKSSLHVIINLTEHCIMKKQYMKPQTIVVQMHSGPHLMSGSNSFENEVVIINKKTIIDDDLNDGSDAASRRNSNLWDDFEEDEW